MLRRVNELHPGIDQIHADELAYHSEIQDDEFKEVFLQCCPYSMVHVTGFYNVYQSIKYIRDCRIPGDLIECGCALGGVAIFMRQLVKRWGLNKTIYLFDTFVGPPVGSTDIIHGGTELVWSQAMENHRFGTEQNIIDVTGSLEGFHIVEGFVEQTLPYAPLPEFSLLRLDTDFYESTKIEFEVLYPKLVRGGVIIVDDYGYFQGSRRATDEYLAKIHPKPLLNRIDTAVWAGVKP